MNRLGVGLLAIGCAAAGCTDTSYGVFILRNQIIGADCTVPSGTGTDYRGFGRLDVTNPIPGSNLENTGYIFAPAVVNGSTPNNSMPNVHTLFLNGADVELRADGSMASNALLGALRGRNLDKRTQHFSGSIAAGATAGVGYPLIDAEQTAAIADVLDDFQQVSVVAHTKIFGTLDGTSVTSDPFDYPITVCKGCLVEDLGPCANLTMATTIHKGGACNPLQDALLDCCTQDGAAVCPAVIPITTP
jgi:hypothetical protein